MSQNGIRGKTMLLAGWFALLAVQSGVTAPPGVVDDGTQLAAPPGACCGEFGCELATNQGGGVYCCDGICQLQPFGGSCSRIVACPTGGGGFVCKQSVCCPNPLPFVDCNLNNRSDQCDPREACCDSSSLGGCTDIPPSCCTGAKRGPGSTCATSICGIQACCVAISHDPTRCQNHTYFDCVSPSHGGTPMGQVAVACNFGPSGNLDNDVVVDLCDNCNPSNPAHGCPTAGACANSNQLNGDGDTLGNVCDNCPTVTNEDQADCDSDRVGNVCDNCKNCQNTNQADQDLDGVGNVCDNCTPSDPGDGCSNPGVNCANPNQHDCDGDYWGDICDTDIDNDGQLNAVDVCDFTPLLPFNPNWTLSTGLITSGPLQGTLRGDLDGDCDVDGADKVILGLDGEDLGTFFDPAFGFAGCASGRRLSTACHLLPASGTPPSSTTSGLCTTVVGTNCPP